MGQVEFDFTGANFIVTGASSGMGRQVACELAQAGAFVLGIARGEEALRQLQQEYPGNIDVAAVDVCDDVKISEAVSAFVSAHGKIDGMVHAAGINDLTPLKSFAVDKAKQITDISYWGAVNILRECTKVKICNAGASFVLFSSVSSHQPDKGMFAYACAKSALRIAARTFAREVGKRKLRINTISPGFVLTHMNEGADDTHNLTGVAERAILGFGQPEDVSGTVLFLLSDRAKWITGADFVVDGGYLA